MTDHKALQKIRALEQQYAEEKEKFEQWKKQNAALAGKESYKNYVDSFTNWERNVQEQLREMRAAVARQPLPAVPPQVPTADLDTQLREALEKIQPMEFVMAIFQVAGKDPSFLPIMFQVLFKFQNAR